jgi:hypothetical protein
LLLKIILELDITLPGFQNMPEWFATKFTHLSGIFNSIPGPLIEEYNRDGKVLLRWCHHCIYQVAVHRYLNSIDKIRASHRAIADLFLETHLETCPFVVPKRSIHIVEFGQRWICPQPLLYSETKYNLRRLNELWFQLIAAGKLMAEG